MTVAPIRRLAAVVALALAVALVPLTASAQDRVVADLDLTVDTIGDPVEASILLSQQTYGSADEAIIATAADGADALASGSLQSGVGEAARPTWTAPTSPAAPCSSSTASPRRPSSASSSASAPTP